MDIKPAVFNKHSVNMYKIQTINLCCSLNMSNKISAPTENTSYNHNLVKCVTYIFRLEAARQEMISFQELPQSISNHQQHDVSHPSLLHFP
jgi:hypothetical protein